MNSSTVSSEGGGLPEPPEPSGQGDDEFRIERASPGDDEERDAFVQTHPRGTFFHLSGWQRAVESVHRQQPCNLVARCDEEIVGVLPMMAARSLSGRRNLVSIPYAVYGGPVGETHAIELRLLEAARKIADEMRVGRLELRYREDPAIDRSDLPGTDLYWTFIRDLPDREEEVLARMPKKARAEARKGRKKFGLDLGEGEWYLDDLARLFLRNKHALGSPGLPLAHFRALLDEFGDRIHVHIVRQNRHPLAAVMSMAFGDTLIAYYAGTEPGADRSFRASNFMYLALQEWAVRHGFRRFDFCRSRGDSGSFQFKRHQGFEPAPLHYRYHLVRDRSTPSFTPSNSRTHALQVIWSKLPLWAARRASDRLARYLC
jgi:FemAB-related protein (PEP-CTERM system-associated)